MQSAVPALARMLARNAPAQVQHRRGSVLGARHDLLESRGEASDLLLLDDKRRQSLDDVQIGPADLAEDLVLMEKRDGHQLSKDPGLLSLDRPPHRAHACALGWPELDRPHQSLP